MGPRAPRRRGVGSLGAGERGRSRQRATFAADAARDQLLRAARRRRAEAAPRRHGRRAAQGARAHAEPLQRGRGRQGRRRAGRRAAEERAGAGGRRRRSARAIRARHRGADGRHARRARHRRAAALQRDRAGDTARARLDAPRAPARRRRRRAPRRRGERADRRRQGRVLPGGDAHRHLRLPDGEPVDLVHRALQLLVARRRPRADPVRRRPAQRGQRPGDRELRPDCRAVPRHRAAGLHRRRGQPRRAAHPRGRGRDPGRDRARRAAIARDHAEPVQGRHRELPAGRDHADRAAQRADRGARHPGPAPGGERAARQGAGRRLGREEEGTGQRIRNERTLAGASPFAGAAT